MPAPLRPISATVSPAPIRRSTPRAGSPRRARATRARAPARRRRRAAPSRRRRRRGGGAAAGAARRERAPRGLDGDGALGAAGEREQARDRGLGAAAQEVLGRAVEGEPAVLEREHAVGGGQAALEPVLGEQHRRPPLLVDAPQHAEQLVARDGVELRGRLVEQQQLRAAGERGAERDPLQLAAGELVGRAVQQPGDPERERRLLHPARDRGRREPAVLERERELRAHRAHQHLRLGVLQQRARDRGQLARAVLARVEPGAAQPAGEHAAVEVRHQPAGGAQQRRLARARAAGDDDELARLDGQRDVAQRVRLARIGVGDAGELEHAHRPTPRRSANGSSTQAARAAASSSGSAAERRPQPRERLERPPALGGGGDRRARRARRRGGEREVVARPRPPLAAGPAREREAAHLQRRRDVGRAVQRARGHRAQHRHAALAVGADGPPRLGEPARVAREHRHEPRRHRGRHAGAHGHPAHRAQQLVGVHGRGEQPAQPITIRKRRPRIAL